MSREIAFRPVFALDWAVTCPAQPDHKVPFYSLAWMSCLRSLERGATEEREEETASSLVGKTCASMDQAFWVYPGEGERR